MQAEIPESKDLEDHLSYSVEYQILCPRGGCTDIKMNGHDYKHKKPVQLFFCRKHNCSFYAHTSWIIIQITTILLQRIIEGLFLNNITATALAKQYRVSDAFISNLVNHCQDHVQAIIEHAKCEIQKVKKKVPTLLNEVIYLDETFFKIGKKSFALIVAINAIGEVLGWKLSRTRKAEDILDVLKQVEIVMPYWKIMIADGSKAYPLALIRLRKSCYLVQHLHSHPWEDVIIHEFAVVDETTTTQKIITVNYTAFSSSFPQQGFTLEKTHKDVPKRKRGRPKGSKNLRKKSSKRSRKRGPKTPKSSGRPFLFENSFGDQFLQPTWFTSPLEDHVKIPSIEEVQRILWIAFSVFGAKPMQSNRIEVENRNYKDFIPDRGLKTLQHYINHLLPFLGSRSLHQMSIQCNPRAYRIGLRNLNQFMVPRVDQISIISR